MNPPNIILNKYDFTLKEETKLYQRGKQEQWDADSLPWELGTQLGLEQRTAGARVLSQFLYGEQASLVIASQLLPLVQDIEARYYLATQAIDEARHVESFYRYISLLGEVQPTNPNMQELVDKILSMPTIEEKMVGSHILIEGLAQEVFHTAAKAIEDPLLQIMLKQISQDEARHVAFGTTYLKKLVLRMETEVKERLMSRQMEFGMLMAGVVNDEAEASATFGLDLEKVTERAIKVHFHRLQEIGLMSDS